MGLTPDFRSIVRFVGPIVLLLIASACSTEERVESAEPLCRTLEDLRKGRIDVGHEDPNEFVGHVQSLEALIAVAPGPVREDLEFVRDRFVLARDAGGFSTLFSFSKLQDPEIGNAEGRVTEFVARECGIQYGEVGWEMEDVRARPPVCPAWPRVGSPLVNNRFPYVIATAAANYFSAQFWTVPFVPAPPGFLRIPRGGKVVFEGEYPLTRYFAFHPNDFETNNFPTLRDVDLDPDPGSENPWRKAIPAGMGRRYTAQLVNAEAPEFPEANSVYVGRSVNGGFNPAVFLIYRIYGADGGALPPNSAGVPLPAVKIFDAAGELVEEYASCDPYPEGHVVMEDRSRMPAFPVPDHRAVFDAGGMNTSSNWGLPVTLLANKDVLYLGLFYTRNAGNVFAVRARKPRTPSRALGIPLHDENVDIRLFTVCGYNFWNGRANDCVLDEKIPVDENGDYTIVVSDRSHRPRNATLGEGVYWLDWGPFLDGQLTYRHLLSSDPLLVRMREAIDLGTVDSAISSFIPRSAHCSRETFESGGWQACLRESSIRKEVKVESGRSG